MPVNWLIMQSVAVQWDVVVTRRGELGWKECGGVVV
jgi:hypothetical protein